MTNLSSPHLSSRDHHRIGGTSGRTHRALAALSLCTSLSMGLLIGVGAPQAQALTLPVHGSVMVPGEIEMVHVAASGTAYVTLPDRAAIAVVTSGSSANARIIDLPRRGYLYDIAVTSDEATAFVSWTPEEGNPVGQVDRVNLATGEVIGLEEMGYFPNQLELTADDKTLVVGVVNEYEAVLVDTASGTIRHRVRVNSGAEAVAIQGNIAYVGSGPTIDAINIETATVIATSPELEGSSSSLAVVNGDVIAAVKSAPPQPARLVALNPRTLTIKRSLVITPMYPEFVSQFAVTGNASRIYSLWGLGWNIEGSEHAIAAIPSTPTGFGDVEPLDTNLDFARAVDTDSTGRWLAVAGASFSTGSYVVTVFETGDETPSVTARARLKGRTLTFSGATVGVDVGTAVRVFVRQGRKFVAQEKVAKVRADGTFRWKTTFGGGSAQVYVAVDGIVSSRITVRR